MSECCGSTRDGCWLNVAVKPRSRESSVGPAQGDRLLVRVAAPPVDGAANLLVQRLVADTFGLPISRVKLLSGHKSKLKRLELVGASTEQVRARLSEL